MIGRDARWKKLGRIVAPDPGVSWMATHAGPSFARPLDAASSSVVDLYVTGRDAKNRSLIGKVRLDVERPEKILSISPEPVFGLGELGAFDENGVSYPYLVPHAGKTYLYYVGWMPTVLTPFQNHLGLAVEEADGTFKRVSRAPILERTDDDFLCTGSSCVIVEGSRWRLWYTCFLKWGKTPAEPKHQYLIKYAESADGRTWTRKNQVCMPFEKGESVIARPSVVKADGRYHMWFCRRGEQFRIGYAHSDDGVAWTRRDDLAGIDVSAEGWDSKAVAYPNVFTAKGDMYMIYCGNDYGREGLGLARLGAAR